MALTRINLPNINIPATTAMETIIPNGRLIALQSGANVVMPNVSTIDCRKKYEIYPNKAGVNDNESDVRKQLEAMFSTIGRTIASDKGFRKK
jgi:biotin synthase